MDYEKLIDLIVNEVYSKLSQAQDKKQIGLKKAVVLWEKEIEKYNILQSQYQVLAYEKEIRECDIVIISKLCLRGLFNLSQGGSVSDEERFILKMIMQGKKVYLLNDGIEYKRYKDTAPKTLYNKYVKYEDELTGFGVRVINEIAEVITEAKPVYSPSERAIIEEVSGKEFQLTNKRLISELDLRKPRLDQVTTVVIDKHSIITPLANDFIRMNHLKIKRV